MHLSELTGAVILRAILPQREKQHRYMNNATVHIELFADGVPMADYNKYNVYVREMHLSLKRSGKYIILCCGCGYAYCDAKGEYLIEITHHQSTIEWRGTDVAPKGHYFFDKKQYTEVVEQLTGELYHFFESYRYRIGRDDVLEDEEFGRISIFPEDLLMDWKEEVGY